MIRNYNFVVKPGKAMELVHKLSTNPEQPRSDLFLGSQPLPEQTTEWQLNYRNSDKLTIGGSWNQRLQEQSNIRTRLASINLTMFENTGSPLRLSYGLEQSNGASGTLQRYGLQYDQRPGPNQTMSLFLTNINYARTASAQFDGDKNWTVRMNYQIRF